LHRQTTHLNICRKRRAWDSGRFTAPTQASLCISRSSDESTAASFAAGVAAATKPTFAFGLGMVEPGGVDFVEDSVTGAAPP
jgi:uncharacterized protein (DUF2062 family)